MADLEDLEITLEDADAASGAPADEKAPVEKRAEQAVEKPETRTVEPDEAISVLKGQLAAAQADGERERNARIAAEQAATRARGDVQDANVQFLTGAVERVKQHQEVLKAQYAQAMADQDYAAAAEAQTQMAEAAANKVALERGLEQLKAQPKPQAADPVETLARQLSPQSAAWVRSHPQYATDSRLNQRLIAAHNLAVTDNLAVDTPEYFAHVEKTLGLGHSDAPAPKLQDDAAMSDAARPVQDRAPAAAPVSRGASGNGSAPRTVRLTKDEVEIAEMMGLTPAEYAKNKLELQKAGRMN